MDEHDDDLASEVIEGEELEIDTFEPGDDEDVPGEENPEESNQDDPPEDASAFMKAARLEGKVLVTTSQL